MVTANIASDCSPGTTVVRCVRQFSVCMQRSNNRLGLFTAFALLAALGIAIALFVQSNTTTIRDALAAEALEQQSDVAVLVQEYDRLVLAVESERLSGDEQTGESIETALTRAEKQLEAMRFNYSFERLDGAATAYAYVKPILEDVRQWITSGIPGVDEDRQRIVSVASERITTRSEKLRDISTVTDDVARELISTQTNFVAKFGKSLMFLLGVFALVASGIALLLTPQRDLQFQIAEAQRQHTQRIKDFADTGADWFWEINSDMRLRWLSGWLLSPSLQKRNEDDGSLPPFEHELTDSDWPIEKLLQQTKFSDFETQWTTRDGAVKTVSLSGNPLFTRAGEFEGFRGVARDITSRKQIEDKLELAYEDLIEAESRGRLQAEQALRDSETFLRTSLNALPENLAILNQDGSILEANTAWGEYAMESGNQPQAGGIGWYFEDIFSRKGKAERTALEDVSLQINDVLQGYSDTLRTEIRFLANDKTVWLAIAASAFYSNGNRYCVLAMEEVTDRKLLEEQDRQLRAELAHVSRLTTVGELATGLAHELNQPLAAISLNCDALISDIDEENSFGKIDVEAIHDIHTEANRAGAIIKGLRMMVRKDTGNAVATDINQLITETMRLSVADENQHDISVRLNLADNLPRAVIDAVQIQQVLVNLERNGVDAIRSSKPEKREMVISTVLLDTGYIRVTVQDSGGEMADEVKKSLFDPFSTTKKDGMGMGLSISRSILESHRGQLWVDFSDPSMTTFHFTLPITNGDAAVESVVLG